MEYTLLFAVTVAVLVAMTPMLRRGIQGMIKLVADQVGLQQNAEQRGGDSGYLMDQYSSSSIDQRKRRLEVMGTTNYIYDGSSIVGHTEAHADLGFTEK